MQRNVDMPGDGRVKKEEWIHSPLYAPLWILHFHEVRFSRRIGVSSHILASLVIAYPRATGSDVSFLPVHFQLKQECRQKYVAGTQRSKGKHFYIAPTVFNWGSSRIFLHRDQDYLA